MEIRLLTIKDLEIIYNFYEEQIKNLVRKEFFYPYQDNDIINILNGQGIMLGAFIKSTLVGISAIDFDKNYGSILKQHINKYYTHIKNQNVYEYSGVLTDFRNRKQGIASVIYDNLIAKMNENICLCAVIQLQNEASLNFFFKRGFRLVSISKNYEIDFGYLIKISGQKELLIDDEDIKIIPSLNYAEYKNLLPQGYVGIKFENGFIKMARLVKK